MSTKPISLVQQIEEIELEVKLRESAFTGARSGRMGSGEAEYRLARIRAVLATLRWLQAHEATIRAAVARPK